MARVPRSVYHYIELPLRGAFIGAWVNLPPHSLAQAGRSSGSATATGRQTKQTAGLTLLAPSLAFRSPRSYLSASAQISEANWATPVCAYHLAPVSRLILLSCHAPCLLHWKNPALTSWVAISFPSFLAPQNGASFSVSGSRFLFSRPLVRAPLLEDAHTLSGWALLVFMAPLEDTGYTTLVFAAAWATHVAPVFFYGVPDTGTWMIVSSPGLWYGVV